MMKRSKSGEREVDITQMIKRISCRISDCKLLIRVITGTDSENYLNPEYVMTAVNDAFNVEGSDGYHIIIRRKLLLEDGETEFR